MSNTNFVAVSDTVRTFVARDFGHFIDGAMQPAHAAARLDVYNPATGERLATVADADANDVDRAVTSAKHAFDARIWSGLRPA
ncbi:aldehyde dehydrogenase family protein, partial [Burkholderia cenocepacia]|nr:aldehyde dehydrogenase family protein [Burkholderia cenocepacia]